MCKIINMTPHAIVVSANGHEATYKPSGTVARMTTEATTAFQVDGFDAVVNTVVGHNLPDPVEGVYLLVSAMVLSAFPERNDLIAPNTGAAVRNDKGHIVSVPGFVTNATK